MMSVLKEKVVLEMYAGAGMQIVASTPAETTLAMREQSAQLGRIIRKLGLRLD